MKSWSNWYWFGWLVIGVGILFGIPETLALIDDDPATQPLTNWTVDRGLGGLAALTGLWLFVHFGRRWWKRKQTLRSARGGPRS